MGALLIQAAMTDARGILNDLDASSGYRYSDSDLVSYANFALAEMAEIRPDLFSVIGDIPCTDSTVIQSAPATSLRLMEIFQVKAGRVVKETTREEMDRFNINWFNDVAAPAKNWMRHPRDPNKFFIYPQSPLSQVLVGQYAKSPSPVLSTDVIPVADAYLPAVANYIVARAEARNDESIGNGRSIAFLNAFRAIMGVSVQAKVVADEEKT